MPGEPVLSTQFTPRFSGFAAKVEASFARQKAMHTLGIRIHDIRPGHVELRMSHREDLTQQHGFIHAGILTTALDSACGYAAYSLMEKNAEVLTVEFKTNLLAPAKGDEFAIRAQVFKSGRTLTVSEGKAYAITNGEEKLVASMNCTLMAIIGRKDVQG